MNINHIMDNPLGINSICHIQIIKRIFTGIKNPPVPNHMKGS
ncbi:hypothetical protein CLOL250_01125 [Clostridium sp. L2-50]|nr:hypothetical protein CLOL250_01125 [Clostridium sp. L2-50]